MGTPKIPLVLDSAADPWFDEEASWPWDKHCTMTTVSPWLDEEAAWGEEDDHRPQEIRTNSPAALWCPSR
jgi:hypothetical protein